MDADDFDRLSRRMAVLCLSAQHLAREMRKAGRHASAAHLSAFAQGVPKCERVEYQDHAVSSGRASPCLVAQ